VSWDEVPDEQENRHHDVLCDGCDVGPGHFQDLNLFVDGFEREQIALLRHDLGCTCETVLASIQVDVITADTSRNAKFQVLGLADSEGVGCVYLGVGN